MKKKRKKSGRFWKRLVVRRKKEKERDRGRERERERENGSTVKQQ